MVKLFHKQKLIFITISCLLIGLILITISLNTQHLHAAVGNHVRYSSPKSYGSSHSSFSGHSYSNDGYSSGFISSLLINSLFFGFRGGPFLGSIWLIFLFYIVVKFLRNFRSYQKTNIFEQVRPQPQLMPKAVDLTALLQIDPNFNQHNFLSYSKEVFVQLQNAWTKKDWELARQFESETLFATHQRQIQEYIQNNTTNVVEKISIRFAKIENIYIQADTTYIDVYLSVISRDYIIDDKTKTVLEGSPNQDIEMNYILSFKRANHIKTTTTLTNQSAITCPSCGAPMSINASGRCEYCGNVISNGEHGWVLDDLYPVY